MSKLFESTFNKQDQQLYTMEQAFKLIRKMGLINEGEYAERSVSKASGIPQCPKNNQGHDLINGVQIKHALTNYKTQDYLRAYFSISGPKRDKSTIYGIATETYSDNEHFFIIPYEAYCHMSANTISVPFEESGVPRYANPWWDYEVEWDEFIQAVKDHTPMVTALNWV